MLNGKKLRTAAGLAVAIAALSLAGGCSKKPPAPAGGNYYEGQKAPKGRLGGGAVGSGEAPTSPAGATGAGK